MSAIFVKVVRVPGAVSEVCLPEGATVADALEAAGITPSANEEVSVNGHKADLSTTLYDTNRVIVSKAAKSAA